MHTKLDYSNVETAKAEPDASSMIETFRAIGYSIDTAIADIIDNSITAEAKNIWVDYTWDGPNTVLSILDDGNGMNNGELIQAMRPGSKNPLVTRDNNDLGRFGLGMKTATFSQCRHLTVLSQKDDQMSCCEWDLEKLSQNNNVGWNLGLLDLISIRKRDILNMIYNDSFTKSDNGTIVLWENIDRIKEQVPVLKQENHFNSLIDDTRRHLELTFHRFLLPARGKKKIIIKINSDYLSAFNPFNPKNLATQELEEQQIVLNGETIIVQPYVLPHHNKVPKQEYDKYSGDGGYLNNQGFYIYRNRRLIIKGTWFRLIKKEELNKLIRVRIDIPNSLDHFWKIDVKKSHAYPPESIRDELKQVISRIEVSGRRVYHQRGKKLSTSIKTPVWIRTASSGIISYSINREHPLVTKMLDLINDEQKAFMLNLITMFESSFPVDMFYNDIASKPEQVEKPKFNELDLEKLIEIYIQGWKIVDIPENEYEGRLLGTEPFASDQKITKKILRKKGYISE